MSNNGAQEARIPVSTVTPIAGEWRPPHDIPTQFIRSNIETFKVGVALAGVRAKSGRFTTTVVLDNVEESCAGIVVGYNSAQQSGFFAGIGGWDAAYALGQFRIDSGAVSLFTIGSRSNLVANRPYEVEVRLKGVEVTLTVDGTEVFTHALRSPPNGNQIGLYAYGDQPIHFNSFNVRRERPRAFVVMQFSEPYDSLWREVIEKVADEEGFHAYRGDDVYHPGVILQDIVKSIRTSDVVIAEVTPRNANVYYELGYAHAVDTPTILLAEKPEDASASLPFDISGYRCIFYEDAIRGKRHVEEALRRHLANIKERRGGEDTDNDSH